MADISKISPDGGTTEYNIKDATARTDVSTINGKIPSGASSSNKMATASDVTTVSNGVTTVTNGVIANTKLIADTVGWSGKNKLPITLEQLKADNTGGTWSGNVYTYQGTTYTVRTDSNGYVEDITVNSSNVTASHNFSLIQKAQLEYLLNYIGEDFILNGCPSGGSDTTYRLSEISVHGIDGTTMSDYGEGKQFTVGDFSSFETDAYIVIRTFQGANISNKVFKPMLRRADILDSAFEPYRNTTAFPRDEQRVLGARNLFNIKENIVTTASNTSYIVTATDITSSLQVTNSVEGAGKWVYYTGVKLPSNIDLIAKFGVTYTSGEGKVIIDGSTDGSNWTELASSSSISTNGDFIVPFNTRNYTSFRIRFYCTVSNSELGDITYNNFTIKLVTDSDDTYAPYAMTNKQLTDAVNLLPVELFSNTTMADIFNAAKAKKADGFKVFSFVSTTGLPTITTGFAIMIWHHSFSSSYCQVIGAYQGNVESAYISGS